MVREPGQENKPCQTEHNHCGLQANGTSEAELANVFNPK